MTVRSRPRRLLRALLPALAVSLLAFGLAFRPVERIDLRSAPFYATSVENVDRALGGATSEVAESPLEAGASRVEIALPIEWNVPLGGNRRLSVLRAEGRRPESVYVRSIALRQGERRIVISCIDVLVVNRGLADLALERIRERLPLASDEFLPVATHTHSGPGGYWEGFLAEQVLGGYQERILDFLAERIAQSAVEAWERLKPARMLAGTVSAGVVGNQIDLARVANREFGLIRFEVDADDSTIDLLNYAAHPASGLDGKRDPRLSGDYPGVVSSILEDSNRLVAFAPGTVGDQRPRRHFQDPGPRVENMARSLIEKGWKRVRPKPVDAFPPLASFEFELHLPPVQLRGLRSWRLRDWIASSLIPDDFTRTRIQIVRIGPVLLLGAPADLSAEVGLPLLEEARRRGFVPFFVSLAEDWIGYVLTEEQYSQTGFKTRAQFHGSVSGTFFSEVYLRVIDRLAEDHPESRRP